MSISSKIIAAALGVAAMSSVYAAEDVYIGANIAQLQYKEDGFQTLNPTALVFKLGAQLNKNFAVEGRVAAGLSDDDVNYYGSKISLELDNYYGVYGKGILPLTDAFSVYGLLGFTHGKVTATSNGGSSSSSDGDLSYGFGADFALSKKVGLNLEVAHLYEGDSYKVNSVSAGLSYKF